MPFYPEDSGEGLPYDIETYWEHLVSDYARLSLFEVVDLDVVEYLSLRRDAYISQLSQTEDGRKYLEKCICFESTDADYDAVTELMTRLGGVT